MRPAWNGQNRDKLVVEGAIVLGGDQVQYLDQDVAPRRLGDRGRHTLAIGLGRETADGDLQWRAFHARQRMERTAAAARTNHWDIDEGQAPRRRPERAATAVARPRY